MNIFSKNKKLLARVFSVVIMSMSILVTFASVAPVVYGQSSGYVNTNSSDPNGLWQRITNFFSPYNNGTNVYTANNYGGTMAVGSGSVVGGGSSYGSSASGYTSSTPKNFYELIVNVIIKGMLWPIIYLLIGGSVVIFLYGVFKFIRADAEKKEEGKEFMLWGIIGLFVMLSVWGLVNVIRNTFNLNDSYINIPHINL